MIVNVLNRETPAIGVTYTDVARVVDVFQNNAFCHQLQWDDGTTATYPAAEWAFFRQDWIPMF